MGLFGPFYSIKYIERSFPSMNVKEKIEENWEKILYSIQLEHGVAPITINTWIRPLKIYDVKDHTIYLLADDTLGQRGIEFLKTKMYDIFIKASIQIVMNEDYDVCFISSPEDLDSESVPSMPADNYMEYNMEASNLNPRYTFDTFVVGDNNRHAHAACVAVAEAPAQAFNPLFLYGGVGLGKTHLMHSVGHYVLQHNKNARVLYVTSETFTNELIEALKKNKMEEFRNKYRNIDLLLLDDIQFIIGKDSTQQEFFHTFNVLHEAGKQIVISSDKAPKEIENLEDRIKSRLEWGLPVDIQSPDYETRMAILRKRAEQDHIDMPDDVIQYIATHIVSNIRELEGALNKISVFSKLDNKPITVDFAEETLKDLISKNTNREITPSLITDIVSEHLGISKADILSSRRSADIAQARQISMYLCRIMTEKSLEAIGSYFGGKDHSTVMHAIEKIKFKMKTNDNLVNTIETIKKKIIPS